MYNSFISQEKERKGNHKNVRKTYYCKLVFVICSYSTCRRTHVGIKSTQGTLAQEHVSTQGTFSREHVNTQGTLAREHVSMQGTLARGHVRHTIQQTPNIFAYSSFKSTNFRRQNKSIENLLFRP